MSSGTTPPSLALAGSSGRNYSPMAAKKRKKRGVSPGKIEKYLADAEKRGELNPAHSRAFNNLLDDVVPPAPKKK